MFAAILLQIITVFDEEIEIAKAIPLCFQHAISNFVMIASLNILSIIITTVELVLLFTYRRL